MNTAIFFLQKAKIHESSYNNRVYPAFSCSTDFWILCQRTCLNILLDWLVIRRQTQLYVAYIAKQ